MPPCLIGIEGFCGAGKSRLASDLVVECGCVTIDTDAFVRTKGGDLHYVERLALPEILDTIKKYRQNPTLRIVIHGICLREILSKLDIEPDVYIYVKRLSQPTIDHNLWHEGVDLEMLNEGSCSLDDWEEPDRSAYRYHLAWKPHEKADAVFERFDAI